MTAPSSMIIPTLPTYISFSSEINQHTTETLLGSLGTLVQQKVECVHILLSTPGGSVMNGITIYNVMRGLPLRIITHNVGNVDSIGNVVFLAGEERYSCPHSTFMFHGVGFNVTTPQRVDQKVLEEHMGSVMADQNRIGSILVERTKLSTPEVETLFRTATTQGPDYALAKGIVHGIMDVKIPDGAPFFQLVFQR